MKEFAFIICYSDINNYNECVNYIQELNIPDGYSIDIIAINEVESVAEAYNAACAESNAKYKIYMQETTFIINQNILFDILEVFNSDASIGMIGVVGIENIPKDAMCYYAWNIGRVDYNNGQYAKQIDMQNSINNKVKEVEAVNGLIIATQYDIRWREDVFDGFNFYDIAHSIEMRKKGYKVVVPYQKKVWCYSDYDVNRIEAYDTYREKIVKTYPDIFSAKEYEIGKRIENIDTYNILKKLHNIRKKIGYDKLDNLLEDLKEMQMLDYRIREQINLASIYAVEKNSVEGISDLVWNNIEDVYKYIKYTLIRFVYEKKDERIEDLRIKVESKLFSKDIIYKVALSIFTDISLVYSEFIKEKIEEPLVSVVIAVYNAEDVIERTLDSVINQTYKNMEIIIVDDASTDSSRDVIDRYNDSRIVRLYQDRNRHVCHTSNIGFKRASGKYIALIGHDDIWALDKIEKQVAFLEKHPRYDACFTWAKVIDEYDNKLENKFNNVFCCNNICANNSIKKLIERDNFFCASSAMIRKDCMDRVGYYKYALSLYQDYELWLRILAQGDVYLIQEVLTYYRRFSDSNRNLSSSDNNVINRMYHERQWIIYNMITNMPNKQFVEIFKKELKDSNAASYEEVICEKAIYLWNKENVFAVKCFSELYEDEKCRAVMEEKYKIEVKDFYKMNGQSVKFDLGMKG